MNHALIKRPRRRNRPAVATPINPEVGRVQLDLIGVAALGGLLLGVSRRHGRTSPMAHIAGLAMIAVAARPFVYAAIRRAGTKRRSVAVKSSIEIDRPVSDVFAFFKDFENFPRVIGSVRSVLDYQDGRSHWELYTPSGGIVEWDAVVNKYVPNSVIAWESVVRSLVDSSGVVRFTALSPTRTRVDLTVTHRPLQTSLKDAARALLAPHASTLIDRHLDRIRFYLESLPARAETAPSPSDARP
jgi:uncharacterized membrane protein